MAMNLLGVSRITEKGAIVHLQKNNSYILTPKGPDGRRRKIPLEERNGLFILSVALDNRHEQGCSIHTKVDAAYPNVAIKPNPGATISL